MRRRILAMSAAVLLLSYAQASAAIVTNTYCDSNGLELVLEFDDALLANAPITSGSFDGNAINVPGATPLNSVQSADPLTFFFNNGLGDAVVINAGSVVGAGTGVFASISGTLTLKSVPEPTSTAGILLLSAFGLGRRRKRVPII